MSVKSAAKRLLFGKWTQCRCASSVAVRKVRSRQMPRRSRPTLLLALASALAVALGAAPASADQAYDKVATAYAQAGGQLGPCAFTQAQFEAAIRGIPPTIRSAVPDLRRAMVQGVAAHVRGDCKGIRPTEGATGGAALPPVTTTPAQTTPAQTTPTPTPTTPAATAPTQPAAPGAHRRDRTPLLIALIAAGALAALVLTLWSLARMRGWDPAWAARMRHGWGEAGFRTTSTWAEFTDWLRLGR